MFLILPSKLNGFKANFACKTLIEPKHASNQLNYYNKITTGGLYLHVFLGCSFLIEFRRSNQKRWKWSQLLSIEENDIIWKLSSLYFDPFNFLLLIHAIECWIEQFHDLWSKPFFFFVDWWISIGLAKPWNPLQFDYSREKIQVESNKIW